MSRLVGKDKDKTRQVFRLPLHEIVELADFLDAFLEAAREGGGEDDPDDDGMEF